MKSRILIVDDEKNAREGLKRGLAGPGYEILLAGGGEEALGVMIAEPVDLVLTDLRMPGTGGMELLERVRENQTGVPVIMMTAYGSERVAVDAMKAGAYDYVTKPVDLDELAIIVDRALSRRLMEVDNAALRAQLEERHGFGNMIGKTPGMVSVFETVRQVAPTRATVLVEGESGTGKELIARAIHASSTRKNGPFVPVHCAALAESLLESELFGHEKGAFTGAARRRIGRFEMADGGTLFLDEVGDLPAGTQVKLLRVLQEQSFERLGGSRPHSVDVRVIAATSRDLEGLMREGTFREDLYYRLNVVSITLPPLRERR
jgi:two-component system, NtrC family, response regulator AtoC